MVPGRCQGCLLNKKPLINRHGIAPVVLVEGADAAGQHAGLGVGVGDGDQFASQPESAAVSLLMVTRYAPLGWLRPMLLLTAKPLLPGSSTSYTQRNWARTSFSEPSIEPLSTSTTSKVKQGYLCDPADCSKFCFSTV